MAFIDSESDNRMPMIIRFLVHEAWGLSPLVGKNEVNTSVVLKIGECTVRFAKHCVLQSKDMAKFLNQWQVSTSRQNSTVPLWNQILVATVPGLPCTATLVLEHSTNSSTSQSLIPLAIFEVQLSSILDHGFFEEWLISTDATNNINDTEPSCSDTGQSMHSDSPIQLHISCSFDADLISSRQHGLWPTCHETDSSPSHIKDALDSNQGGLVLMCKCPLSRSSCRHRVVSSGAKLHNQPGPDALALYDSTIAAQLGPARVGLGRDVPAGADLRISQRDIPAAAATADAAAATAPADSEDPPGRGKARPSRRAPAEVDRAGLGGTCGAGANRLPARRLSV